MNIQSKIRFALKEDVEQIIDLCEAHAFYEGAEYKKDNKVEELLNDLFSKAPKLHCLVVESDHLIIGYATYMKQYATWEAREYIYMDCLFLKERVRGLGIGRKILQRIQEEGEKLNCSLIQWQTPTFNTKAIKFYKKTGANSKHKARFFLHF